MRTVFTSESVTEGHPDKLCDQISDAVLDAILARDPMARVACETCATTGLVQVMGEITTSTYVAIDEIARHVIRDIGYTSSESLLRRQQLRRADRRSCPKSRYRHGRGQRAGNPRTGGRSFPRRRRSGHDVRLCLQPDPRIDAPAYLAGPPADPPPDRGAQEWNAPVAPTRRQKSGDGGV